ncbi:hypothetical protein Btru_037923 [Bulinus truncatus]|nr:hypothetical protein Btru_037923 [Bulinus truncatus]
MQGSLGSVNATNMTPSATIVTPSATNMTPSATTFGASEASGQGNLLLLEVVDSLSGRCRATIAASVKQFTSQVNGGCDYLESIRNQLLDSRICPLEDYENLHDFLCRKGENDAAKISDEVRLRQSFLTALNNDVSSSCHDALTPEVVQLTDDLPAGYRKFISMISRLVADGSCTDLDLVKLTKELCGKVQRITDDVNRVLQNDITSKCKVAMTSGTTSIIQKTNQEACDSVKAFKDMLLISDFCTADDYRKLYHVTCGRSVQLVRDMSCNRSVQLVRDMSCNRSVQPISDMSCNRSVQLVRDMSCNRSVQLVRDMPFNVQLIRDVSCNRPVQLIRDVSCNRSVQPISDMSCNRSVQLVRDMSCNRSVQLVRDMPFNADPLRDHIMCIIETQLSSDACKSTARAQAQAGSDPTTACSTLETFRLLLPIVGCTTNDYNILHSVICEHQNVTCTPAVK